MTFLFVKFAFYDGSSYLSEDEINLDVTALIEERKAIVKPETFERVKKSSWLFMNE